MLNANVVIWGNFEILLKLKKNNALSREKKAKKWRIVKFSRITRTFSYKKMSLSPFLIKISLLTRLYQKNINKLALR